MADLLATAVVYHADEFVDPVCGLGVMPLAIAVDPVVVIIDPVVVVVVNEVAVGLAVKVGDEVIETGGHGGHGGKAEGGGRKMERRVGRSIGMDHGGRTRGGQSKLTKKGQEIPINFDVEKIVERTKQMQESRKFDVNGGGKMGMREYGRNRRGSIVYFSRCEPLSLRQRRRMRRRWKRRVCVKL